MVAVTLEHPALVVFLVLLHGNHLRGAGLACELVLRSGTGAGRSATRPGDIDHGVAHQVDVVRSQRESYRPAATSMLVSLLV